MWKPGSGRSPTDPSQGGGGRFGAQRLPDRPEAPGVAWIGPGADAVPSSQTPARGTARPSAGRGLPIGERLVRAGALASGDLVRALAMQARQDSRLGEILLSKRMVSEAALSEALSAQWRAQPIELGALVPDPRLVAAVGAERCLHLGTVPLARKGNATLVATGRPERFADVQAELELALGKVVMALAPEREVAAAIARAAGPELASGAETRTPSPLSCRFWRPKRAAWILCTALALLLLASLVAPLATLSALTLFCMATLGATAVLKGLALGQALRCPPVRPAPSLESAERADAIRLPMISVLIPLLREEDVAASLLRRLRRLRYPRELTDLILLVEEDDPTTRTALARTRLPDHIRMLVVPPGSVETKPRALNYGLSFARGRIVGIWDAEDAPERDQLHRVAAHFARADPRVACVQGALDFYNTRTNWLSRCFTLEYATWFRAFLPGLQALDLPIPLGGTTLFFRRAVLDEIGGWDAHNVTEDADLGIRLYRAGYRTEIVDTVTREEANCRLVPWIRQRSRWLKGYAMTYAVHMRAPRRLWSDMGARGFAGFQVLFVGTLTQFLLSPLLLSLWLLTLTSWHPLEGHLPRGLGWAFLALVLVSEAISMGLTIAASRGSERARLLWWLPTLPLYFPLAALAAYRGVWEMLARPFYWDKTEHGVYAEEPADAAAPAPGGTPRPPALPGHAARLRRRQVRRADP